MPRQRSSRRVRPATLVTLNVPLAENVSEIDKEEQLKMFLTGIDSYVSKCEKEFDRWKRKTKSSLKATTASFIENLPKDIRGLTMQEVADKGISLDADTGISLDAGDENDEDDENEIPLDTFAMIQKLTCQPTLEDDGMLADIMEEGSNESSNTANRPTTSKKLRAPPSSLSMRSVFAKYSTVTPLSSKFSSLIAPPTVTPKFNPLLPQTPENIRKMKPGEMLMSIDGSPVEARCNVNDMTKKLEKDLMSSGLRLAPKRMQTILGIFASNMKAKK